uniref:Uncharacterized protein n=1 Tax=Romanomermis culicivorax TaxID=13658 RepID=A0A915HI29_ROMCU
MIVKKHASRFSGSDFYWIDILHLLLQFLRAEMMVNRMKAVKLQLGKERKEGKCEENVIAFSIAYFESPN